MSEENEGTTPKTPHTPQDSSKPNSNSEKRKSSQGEDNDNISSPSVQSNKNRSNSDSGGDRKRSSRVDEEIKDRNQRRQELDKKRADEDYHNTVKSENQPQGKSNKNPKKEDSGAPSIIPDAGNRSSERTLRKPKASAGGAVLNAGVGMTKDVASRAKSSAKGTDIVGEEEETDDKPKKDKKGGLAGQFAKKAATAGAAKVAAAAKMLLFSPKGLIVLLVLILIPIILTIFVIISDTAERTLSHTQKYGCVEDKFTLDFLELLSPGNGASLGEKIGDLFSDTESSCTDGSGWTGEFYPPTVGVITTEWYYASGKFHGATDISNGREGPEAPIFAYAGGEVISRTDGTENTIVDQKECTWDNSQWAYTRSVQGELIISHQPGLLQTRYAHMWKQHTIARVGDIVSAGDEIAGQGNTGWSCGTHLHFEIEESGVRVNPIDHMAERGIVFPYTIDTLPPKPTGDTGENPAGVDTKLMSAATQAMKNNGIPTSSSEKTCLTKLWNRESGWNYQAENPSSGAYGIPQALPGEKMVSAGADWRTNPVTQINWGISYIKSRYGTPCGAWAHSEANNWY